MSGFNTIGDVPWGRCIYNRHDIFIGQCIARHGEFSEDELITLRQITPIGTTFLDVGANIGALAIPMAMHVGYEGAVVAFEPQRLLFQTLCGNAAINSISNLFPVRAGLDRESGTMLVPLFDPDQPNMPGRMVGSAPGADVVPTMRLDDIDPATLQRVSVIKIDVEGMELAVLEGAHDTLETLRPVIYIENDREDQSPRLIDLLSQYRYRMFWDVPRLVRSGPETDVKPLRSMNMLCAPIERECDVYLEPVLDRDDTPQAAVDRVVAKRAA